MKRFFISLLTVFLFLGHGWAQVVEFDLQGMASSGITASNEPGKVIDGGSGDEVPGGIFLDLQTGDLFVDVEWGSGNGYIDLSSDIDFMNIHGPTSTQAPVNFAENGETFVGLNGFNASRFDGGYSGVTSFTGNVVGLLEGRYYLHLHTFVNAGGEARGYLVPEIVVGDTNGDGLINLLDVVSFVNAIAEGEYIDEADMNRDGILNLLDVEGFVNLLSGS